MRLDELHPDYRSVIGLLPHLPMGSPTWRPVVQVLSRWLPRTRVVRGVSTHDLAIGPVRLRVYVPDRNASGAGLVWMHGGGLIIGSERQDNRLLSTYARDLGLVVVSVGYRLAPQHPFPAAHEDCVAAWRWFLDHAEAYGVDPHRIGIASESGGGSHSASLVHRLRDDGGVQPACHVLFEPMLDDRTAADPSLDLGHFVWRWIDDVAGWTAYLGHPPGQPDVPEYAVPARRDDLSGLPPTWVGVGDKDLFHAEASRYAERLRDAGGDVELVVMPGAPHGFHVLMPRAEGSRAFQASAKAWLRRWLGPS